MGYQDRDYYRDKSRGPAWFAGTAPAVKAIIALNVGIFLLGKFLPDQGVLYRTFDATSTAIFGHGQVWRLVTSAFLHSPENLWHLAGNMMFLWFIGRDMEAFYGTREFWWLYLSAAVVSSLCWAGVDVLNGRGAHAVGASGAVMAVVALYTFYNPRRPVILFIFPVEMWVVLALFAANDALGLLGHSREPIGFAAHLGGFAYAVAYKVFDLRLKHLSGLNPFAHRRPTLRIVSADPPPPREAPAPTPRASASPAATRSPTTATSSRPAATAVISEELLDARLDEVLGKIAREGRDNLTNDEKLTLDEASRRARNRRNGGRA